MIDNHKIIYKLFETEFTYTDDNFQFVNSTENIDLLKQLDISYEKIHKKYLSINKTEFPFLIFTSISDFLKLSNFQKQLNELMVIIKDKKPISFINGETFVNFIENETNFINNVFAYWEFIDFLKTKDTNDDNSFHFIDYFNQDYRKIVLSNLTDKGRIIIKYTNIIPTFDEKINYKNKLNEFINCFNENNNHLPKFLKNSLIEYSSRYSDEDRMENIFNNLNQIVLTAKINFEVYLNNLSIDSIKKDYDEFKSKYFEELSDILSNMTNKIIGLPIGISATLFAVSKIENNPIFLILILLTLIVTLFYISLLLKINFKDVIYISQIYKKDFDSLQNNNFFKKFPDEIKDFEIVKDRITSRIKHLKLIVESYFWVLGISNIILIGFIFNKLSLKIEYIFFISLIEIFVLILVRNNILNKDSSA